MSLRCDSQTAEKIAGRMLGSVGAVDPKDVPDTIAEICNMVAGNFKSKIGRLAELQRICETASQFRVDINVPRE